MKHIRSVALALVLALGGLATSHLVAVPQTPHAGSSAPMLAEGEFTPTPTLTPTPTQAPSGECEYGHCGV